MRNRRLTHNNICTSKARKPLLWGRLRWEHLLVYFPDAMCAGYHLENHAVKAPIASGITLFTTTRIFPMPALFKKKVHTAVRTYRIPHAKARM